jgi:hypothetical protein
VKETDSFSGWRDSLNGSLELARRANAYCSVTLYKDLREERLKDRNYVALQYGNDRRPWRGQLSRSRLA